jgi:hypothetical protein
MALEDELALSVTGPTLEEFASVARRNVNLNALRRTEKKFSDVACSSILLFLFPLPVVETQHLRLSAQIHFTLFSSLPTELPYSDLGGCFETTKVP